MAKTSPSVNKKNTESVISQNKDLNDNAMAMMNNKILETIFEKSLSIRNNPFKYLATKLVFKGYFYSILFAIATIFVCAMTTALTTQTFDKGLFFSIGIFIVMIFTFLGFLIFTTKRQSAFLDLYTQTFKISPHEFTTHNLENAVIATEAILNSSYSNQSIAPRVYELQELHKKSDSHFLTSNQDTIFAQTFNFIVAHAHSQLHNKYKKGQHITNDPETNKSQKIQDIYQDFIKTLK